MMSIKKAPKYLLLLTSPLMIVAFYVASALTLAFLITDADFLIFSALMLLTLPLGTGFLLSNLFSGILPDWFMWIFAALSYMAHVGLFTWALYQRVAKNRISFWAIITLVALIMLSSYGCVNGWEMAREAFTS